MMSTTHIYAFHSSKFHTNLKIAFNDFNSSSNFRKATSKTTNLILAFVGKKNLGLKHISPCLSSILFQTQITQNLGPKYTELCIYRRHFNRDGWIETLNKIWKYKCFPLPYVFSHIYADRKSWIKFQTFPVFLRVTGTPVLEACWIPPVTLQPNRRSHSWLCPLHCLSSPLCSW